VFSVLIVFKVTGNKDKASARSELTAFSEKRVEEIEDSLGFGA